MTDHGFLPSMASAAAIACRVLREYAWHSAMPMASAASGPSSPCSLQQRSHHQLHLFLLRAALPDDGELHLARRVLEHLGAGREHRTDRRASRLPELERAVGVAMHEHALDGDFARRVFAHQFEHAFEDLPQPRRKLRTAGADGAAGHVVHVAVRASRRCRSRSLCEPGIDAQDADRCAAGHGRARPERPASAAAVDSRQFPPCSEPGNRASYDTVFPRIQHNCIRRATGGARP